MAYEPHEMLVAPARGKAELWRTAIGFALAVTLYAFLLNNFANVLGSIGGFALIDEFIDGETPRGALLFLTSFICMALAPIIIAQILHRRAWFTLIGPLPQAFRDFWVVVRAMAILSLVFWVLLPSDFEMRDGLDFGPWLMVLPLSLVALAIQTGAEEVAFRGYLQSQLAARIRSPFVWMVIPSVIFAAGHYAPDEAGGNAMPFAALAFVFGLITADLTARTGTLGAAIGFHFANNIIAILISSFPGSMSGLALYLTPFEADDVAALTPIIWFELGAMGVSWLAARVALRV